MAISKALKKALHKDTYFISIHEHHIDTMNDWADSNCNKEDYQLLIELYEMFISGVKDRIKELNRHIKAKCTKCGEDNNYRDGSDYKYAICNGCGHSWKFIK